MNASRNLKAPRSWRALFLSTGETPARQKIEEEKRTARAGQLLRMLDIPAAEGIIVAPQGKTPAEFADHLKRACARYFGTAGPAFLQALIKTNENFQILQNTIQDMLDDAAHELTPKRLAAEETRALRRLALVHVAGTLAVRLGILPLAEAEIYQAIRTVRDAWLGSLGLLSGAARGVQAVREFMLRHYARFRDPTPCSLTRGSASNQKTVNSNGKKSELPAPMSMSLTCTVPASVPSLFQSSMPVTPSLARK